MNIRSSALIHPLEILKLMDGRLKNDSLRGVYTIESLEQMLQKNFRGEDLTSNQGGMYSKKNICRLAAVIFFWLFW